MADAIRRIDARVYRYPVSTPVRTSFGIMHDRPAVFVRVEDHDGVVGWGEAWCNFPTVGAEHRARLVNDLLAPMLVGRAFASPADAFRELTDKTAVLAIQSGEHGPIAQALAGVDIALWDIAARRARQPLWKFLGGVNGRVRAYASGINPDAPERVVERMRGAGHRAFKLKVGFGDELDRRNLGAIRAAVGDDISLAVDANQGWSRDEAVATAPRFAEFNLAWIEEPLRADRPWSEWRAVKSVSPTALAAGENIASEEAFSTALQQNILSIVQPDIAKWGGLSGCLSVARAIIEAGASYYPHFLGAGVGLLASAHLLAGVGGDGMLEIDINDNPLRDGLCGPVASVVDGVVTLTDEPGLGVAPDLEPLRRYHVLSQAIARPDGAP